MNFEEVSDPLVAVDQFRKSAGEAGLALPEAMVLATVDAAGSPHARVVLYKGRSGRTIEFFTNYHSNKAQELSHRPEAEVCIHYPSLALQVRMHGPVQKLDATRSDEYFSTRPRESQIGAWASQQSQPLALRQQLDQAVVEVKARFEGLPVPRPPHWGGYGLLVETVELWIGQSGRLHDRARYRFEDQVWRCERLYP